MGIKMTAVLGFLFTMPLGILFTIPLGFLFTMGVGIQFTISMEFFEHLLTLEIEYREAHRIATSLKVSGLPKSMHLDNFDYLFQPAVARDRLETLATGDFIRRHENVLFFGPPGVGKTHLAVGLGVRAIELGYSVIYYTVEELLNRPIKYFQLKQRRSIYFFMTIHNI